MRDHRHIAGSGFPGAFGYGTISFMLQRAVRMKGYLDDHLTAILFTGKDDVLSRLLAGQSHGSMRRIFSAVACAGINYLHIIGCILDVHMNDHGHVALAFFPGYRRCFAVTVMLTGAIGMQRDIDNQLAAVHLSAKDNVTGHLIFSGFDPSI